jgi:phage terminase large subunit-like protein
MIDAVTQSWIRNPGDERAAAAGCRFDLERAAYTAWWITRYCRLYEGEWAGEPMLLRGAESQSDEPILDEWDRSGKKKTIQRLRDYMDCQAAGEACDWQLECVARLFGWVRQSQRWKREIRRFREAVIVVAKKNKKTPTVAAIGLYLLCGDGEKGQKVFLAAKDGKQIRDNMSQHVLEMVRQSAELAAVCKINLNEMSVLHQPTRSLMKPLSSSNSRTKESKEGLNGCLLVDEIHVVDEDFMSRVSRTGISRAEPLRLEVTTAGNNPDGYGYDRVDYAREVLAGREENQALFAAVYEAPQNLGPADLEADPIRYGRMANPAWGHTIDPEEYLADYQTSKRSLTALLDFMMYRLNVWQRSSNPWIRPDDWANCRRPFTAEDLEGQVCGAALDLGKTDDMSALALVFPDNPDAWVEAAQEAAEGRPVEPGSGDERRETAADPESAPNPAEIAKRMMLLIEQPVKLLVFYWLPEQSLDKYRGDASYAEWRQAGWLRTTEGAAVDSTAITEAVRDILLRYQVKMFGYDPWYAAPVLDVLLKQNCLPEDYTWKFPQTIHNFAWPAALFERLILAGNLQHDGNPITSWEMGHVRAKQDDNGNMRPVKPARGDDKKIDGVVATIMGLDAATRLAANISVYEQRGLLMV